MCCGSSLSVRATAAMKRGEARTFGRPVSNHVYQETLTEQSAATSSRRSPGTRRLPVTAIPASAGEMSDRANFRNS